MNKVFFLTDAHDEATFTLSPGRYRFRADQVGVLYWNGSVETMTRYYSAGGTRVAVRNSNGSGTKTAEVRYKAWGETRYTSGTLPTRYTYTGQYSYANDFGLVELEEKDSIEYVRLSYTFLYRINDSMQSCQVKKKRIDDPGTR